MCVHGLKRCEEEMLDLLGTYGSLNNPILLFDKPPSLFCLASLNLAHLRSLSWSIFDVILKYYAVSLV